MLYCKAETQSHKEKYRSFFIR